MEKLYADIIINISHEALDKVFAYKVPFFHDQGYSGGTASRCPIWTF